MLARIRHAGRIYWKLQMLHLRMHLEYETDFVIGIAGMFLNQIPPFIFVWTLFGNTPQVAGWELWEVTFLYALLVIPQGLVQLFCNGQWLMQGLVNQGGLDRLLIRPVSPAIQVITQISSIHGLGSLLLGGYVLVLSLRHLAPAWGAGHTLFLFVTLLGSVVTVGSIDFAANCIAFWYPATNTSFPFLVYNLSEFAKFPITLYGRLLQTVITWIVPFAFVSYYPGCVLLGKPLAQPVLGYAAPVVSVLTLMLARLVWRRGLRRYEGVGH